MNHSHLREEWNEKTWKCPDCKVGWDAPVKNCPECGKQAAAIIPKENYSWEEEFEKSDFSKTDTKYFIKQIISELESQHQEEMKSGNVSDGYHTFNELYEHRHTLFIALCKERASKVHKGHYNEVWRSKLHHDGSSYDGWFILGLFEPKGEQITYHLPLSKWDETSFAKTLDRAPEFDGHTPNDVLGRIANLYVPHLSEFQSKQHQSELEALAVNLEQRAKDILKITDIKDVWEGKQSLLYICGRATSPDFVTYSTQVDTLLDAAFLIRESIKK